ncbi:hypothetical protein [Alishewanella sp. HH-ZS]|nr:hypothetical protein [Alishewanella sp. HH-ZS]
MKKRYTEEQIIKAIKQHEAGAAHRQTIPALGNQRLIVKLWN